VKDILETLSQKLTGMTRSEQPRISVVVPLHNEAGTLPELYTLIKIP